MTGKRRARPGKRPAGSSAHGRRRVPYGTWPSPLTADVVAAGSVRLSGLWLDGEDVYWTESRPAAQGRVTLLRRRGGGAPRELLPAPFSVRTRVHEYGGGAFAVRDGQVVFVNERDQRLYRLDPGTEVPTPLTAPGPLRYADLQFDPTPTRPRLLCVVESARPGGEPENLLASVALADGEVVPLLRGADFYAFPRLDPAGQRLAFLSWSHPAMPWDACRLHVAQVRDDGSLAEPVFVAGGEGEAVFAPLWSPGGELTFVSDRSGFHNLHRWDADGRVSCLYEMAADFAAPLWVFGLSTYAWLDERTLIAAFQRSGRWHLATLEPARGRLDEIPSPLTEIGPLFASAGRAVFVGGSPSQGLALFTYRRAAARVRRFHRPAPSPLPARAIAHPLAYDFPTADGGTVHGLLYLPRLPGVQGPEAERPPLVVVCHGGPTGSASTALNLGIQFWTSRGFAVLDVNYRGSTGYGRAYRKRLDGQWGVADVEDCVAGARGLAEAGRVDGGRMAIRGSSAGGLTVLSALAFHDTFAVGASYYGVCDLESLARDTHKFESHYLETLVGPYPACRDRYRARSPLHAADRLSCPVIFFHGEEDKVVPLAQAEAMAKALRQRGLTAPLRLFPGEQHGFRRRETIAAALTAELAFYRQVLGLAAQGPSRGTRRDGLPQRAGDRHELTESGRSGSRR